MIKVYAHNSIGPVRIIVEDTQGKYDSQLAGIVIPDEYISQIAAECIRRTIQQNVPMSDNFKQWVCFAAEQIPEIEAFKQQSA